MRMPVNMVNQCLFYVVNRHLWCIKKMNIASTDEPLEIVAKMCCCKDKEKKVIYSFVDNPYGLCIDKKDVIFAELEACERLLKYAQDTGVMNEQTKSTLSG